MLSIQLFRTDREKVLAGLTKKNFGNVGLVDRIIHLDDERRKAQAENDALAARINQASKSIGQLLSSGKKKEAEQLKQEIAEKKAAAKGCAKRLSELDSELHDTLVKLPNLPHEIVPQGRSSDDNEVVRQGGPAAVFSPSKKPHWEIAIQHRLIDFELGTQVTGSGFPFYIGKGARLQRALVNYFLDYNVAAGYEEYYPPYVVNERSAFGTGQLPDKEGQMYHITADDLFLIPTAEVPVTNVYRDRILSAADLPVKMTAWTPCFRREAGSYGKDVRGLNRVHQFDKVEIVQIAHPEKSYECLNEMVAHVETLIQSLGLPYRILRLCGGDMGFTSALTYDFEVFSVAQNRWLEVSSVSNFESFQSNRMKIRFREENGKPQQVHTLNGSSLALPRIMACLLEQYQDEERILIPEKIRPYFGADTLI